MSELTSEQLAELRALAENIPGTWKIDLSVDADNPEDVVRYITAACNAVPGLIDEIDRLRARVKEMENFKMREAFNELRTTLNEYDGDLRLDLLDVAAKYSILENKNNRLRKTIKQMIDYCDRNTLNFQREKLMDFVEKLREEVRHE